MTSTLSLNRRCNLSQINFSNQCEQAGRHWCSLYKFYMLQIYFTELTRTLQKHPFLIFLLKMHKDCDNLISLGTRSHIFGSRNETDSVPCLTEFTLSLFNVSFRRKLYGRETCTNISFKMGGENPCKTL